MKIFMKVLTLVFTIAVLVSLVPFESTCNKLENDVFRLHILANSDTEFDQELKLMVRDEVVKKISPLYNDAKTKEEAISITRNKLSYIENVANNVITSNGKKYTVNAEIRKEFFDTRYYDEFTMPAGVYDSLTISIGEAKGKNWWCVMYPSLCVGASSKVSMQEDLTDDEYEIITSDDVVFKFKIVEYYEKIRSVFSR